MGLSTLAAVDTVSDAASILESAFASNVDRVLPEVAKALARIDAKDAVPTLIAVLEQNEPAREWVAAWALGLLRAREAAPALRRAALGPAVDLRVRQHAIEALGYVDDGRAVPDLIGLLVHIAPEIRYWTAFALGQIGDERSLPGLQRLADEDDTVTPTNLSVRHAALDAIEVIRAREKRR
jgi:HEAT repeat protein